MVRRNDSEIGFPIDRLISHDKRQEEEAKGDGVATSMYSVSFQLDF